MTEPTDTAFLDNAARLAPTADPERLGAGQTRRLMDVFDSQLGSRHLDLAARWLRAQGKGFYTIGSAGHEGNAAVAASLRPTDPALLHYRSGAFYVERARQVPGQHPLRDVMLGVAAAADEPMSGGRHKVFGNRELNVIPQTSTIASHLPRALGVAFAIDRARKLGLECAWPADSIVVCSFGDASANHSTAQGAFNAAAQSQHQGLRMPLLFVCEDNGFGISVRTPSGWIARRFEEFAGLKYFHADGSDPIEALGVADAAADWVRTKRRPAFLHLRTVRLMGHAGSDVESTYRTPQEITADYRSDPLLGTARTLVAAGALSAAEVIDRYEAKRDEVREIAVEATSRPQLVNAGQVMAPLTAAHPGAVAAHVRASASKIQSDTEKPLTLAQAINRSIADVLTNNPQALVFGEDVARKGGVYGVTRGLAKSVGAARVFDTILDEQTILGIAAGTAVAGFLPIPEIQYLAYLHNAEDQLRGEAASLSFFSNGQYQNPMVIRIAGYGYQKGFGGHFHNDNSVAALRDIPGIVIASPARPDDAAAMMATCAAAAAVDGKVCVFLEPIALYHSRDLHEDGDGGWLATYPDLASDEESPVPIGTGRLYGDGNDVTILTFGNGLFMSLRVAQTLRSVGIECRVLDLRWLAPLPEKDILREAEATGRVLVVDETRRSGGVSEAVIAVLVDNRFDGRIARVTSEDSFIPLGDAANHVFLTEDQIWDGVINLFK